MLRFSPLRAPKNSSISTTSHYCLVILVLHLCGKCSHTISNIYMSLRIIASADIRSSDLAVCNSVAIYLLFIDARKRDYPLFSSIPILLHFLIFQVAPICQTPRAPKQISLLNLRNSLIFCEMATFSDMQVSPKGLYMINTRKYCNIYNPIK